MKEEDIKYLEYVYARLKSMHGGVMDFDYIIKFKSITDELKNEQMEEWKELLEPKNFALKGKMEIRPATKETKYKVDMPEMIRTKDINLAVEVRSHTNFCRSTIDPEPKDGYILVKFENINKTVRSIPGSWLVEIKEESRPCTDEESWKNAEFENVWDTEEANMYNDLYRDRIKAELKPAMKKIKRWKLVIPDEVPREYMEGRTGLYVLNGAEVELVGIMTADGVARIKAGKQPNTVQEHCPESWLVEIPTDKPVTSEESWEALEDEDIWNTEESKSAYMHGFKDCAKNEALKHRETQTFKEWINLYTHGLITDEDGVIYTRSTASKAWKAALKSRGYE